MKRRHVRNGSRQQPSSVQFAVPMRECGAVSLDSHVAAGLAIELQRRLVDHLASHDLDGDAHVPVRSVGEVLLGHIRKRPLSLAYSRLVIRKFQPIRTEVERIAIIRREAVFRYRTRSSGPPFARTASSSCSSANAKAPPGSPTGLSWASSPLLRLPASTTVNSEAPTPDRGPGSASRSGRLSVTLDRAPCQVVLVIRDRHEARDDIGEPGSFSLFEPFGHAGFDLVPRSVEGSPRPRDILRSQRPEWHAFTMQDQRTI